MAIPKELEAIVRANFKLTVGGKEWDKYTRTMKVAEAAYLYAQKYGINPLTLFKLIQAESGWDIEGPRGADGEVGLGQILPSTGAGIGPGYTVEQLADPFTNVHAAAQYLKQQIDYFGGDEKKGLAAYHAGAGNINRAIQTAASRGTDWISEADKLGYDTSRYLTLAGRAPNIKTDLPQSGPSAARRTPPNPENAPDPSDYYFDPLTQQPTTADDPNGVLDTKAYRDAYNEWKQFRTGGREDLKSYLTSIYQSIESDIANKRLSTEQATAELNARVQALNVGSDMYTSLIGTALRPGTKYFPGYEPGGVYATLGAHPSGPREASQPTLNPFQTALDTYRQGTMPTSVGTADTNALRGLSQVAASGQVPASAMPAAPISIQGPPNPSAASVHMQDSFQRALELVRAMGGR